VATSSRPDLLIVDAWYTYSRVVIVASSTRSASSIATIRTEVAHGQQESVEGRPGSRSFVPFAIDEVENFSICSTISSLALRNDAILHDSQQGAKDARAPGSAARAKYEATRAFGRQAAALSSAVRPIPSHLD